MAAEWIRALIRVIVPLEDQIDVVLVENGDPVLADAGMSRDGCEG